MTRLTRLALPLLVALPLVGHADVSGTYVEEQNPSASLVLVEAPDGTVTGNFTGVSSIPLTARRARRLWAERSSRGTTAIRRRSRP